MDSRRSYLKELATQLADAWAASASPVSFGAETRVETRNTIYLFKEGLCASVTRRERAFQSDPTSMIGMRLVGWLFHDDPYAGLQEQWRPGAFAVLWRARAPHEAHSQVALTSTTTAMAIVHRPEQRRPAPAVVASRASQVQHVTHVPTAPRARVSTPPPLPRMPTPPVAITIAKRPTAPPPLPPAALQRPASPVSMVIPKIQSMTRIHSRITPLPPPPTPTPTTQRHAIAPSPPRVAAASSRPPPLPPHARARAASSGSHITT